MSKQNYSQSGFTVIEVLLLVVLIGVIGFVGYRLLNNKNMAINTTTSNTSQVSEQTKAPAIAEKQDLSNAVEQLKKVDTNTKTDEEALRNIVK